MSYFKPNKDRTDVVTSLEESAARLLKPDIKDLLNDSKADRAIQRIDSIVQKLEITLNLLARTTKLQAMTIVTKDPPTACLTETVTNPARNCS